MSSRSSRSRSRSLSRSVSRSRSGSPQLKRVRRYFSPSPDRGESFSFFDVPSEFSRGNHFLKKNLLQGSGGDYGDKEGVSFSKFTRFEALTGEIDAGNVGECLPFGYTSFLDFLRDIATNFSLKYSLFVAFGLGNFWEECVISIEDESFELRRGVNSEVVIARISYDSIYALSPLSKEGHFTLFYNGNRSLRVMHERYETGFIVYYAFLKLSENGRSLKNLTSDLNVDWETIPNDVLSKILFFTASSLTDVATFSLVSNKFYAATQIVNQDFWKGLYELEFNEIAYIKYGTERDWKSLIRERKRIQDISAYDVLRCVSPSQRDLKLFCGISFFDTHIFNCALFSGKWYYEFIMPEQNIDALQVGITSVLSKPFYHVGFEYFGVGDDDFSWAYDGVRSQRFHGNTTGGSISDYWHENNKWVPGDVIRVCMDMDQGELRFLHNHIDLGVAYTFPVQNRVTNYGEDMPILEPVLPYYPAITCQQSTYGGEILVEVIIQRSKTRYPPPEGFSCLGELMEEKQFVDKLCLTHVGESMTGLVLHKQLTAFKTEMESMGLIEVPPGIENVGVDAGEFAQRSKNTSNNTNNDFGGFNWDY